MKKLILALCLVIGASQLSQAQIDFGIKAGLNYNSDSFKDVSDDIINGKAESKTGYHAGIWLRAKLPIIGWYVRPELVYTALKSEITLNDGVNTKASYDFQKIDIPVLLGKKFLGVAYVHAGPSFQYIIDGDLDFEEVAKTNADGFTVGIQLGAGVELGKIGLDIRWERGFSDTESEIVSNASDKLKFDTRVNQIIVGLSYKF
ncbi:outer membrane protein with beta-barrel domain [Tenacibaculum adriaticum]|uniref:Outer membrane protein with beta-barrel domain n=1 Tax=Tenacibaculum adriaticum TaxID=413713 RepID=A0A5S5DSW7_9FLAO|nr:porin family protein [Tenacibaculum adriaticum]TYP98865.1 outer membrane protein with beta-barrel domain [Tenacibaculum adriaticum]